MLKRITKIVMTTALAVTMLMSNVVTAQAAPIKVGVSDLFDAEYYAENNPDVKAAFGNDEEALFNHFKQYGMKEGRTFTKMFDLQLYKGLYPDLRAAFGDKWEMYLAHYLVYGINEGRDGGGEFDIVSYIKNNPDLIDVFGNDFKAIINHYKTFGIKEGRVAISPARKQMILEQLAKSTVASYSDDEEDDKDDSKPSKPAPAPSKPEQSTDVYMTDGVNYYNYTQWQKAVSNWESEEPDFDEYFLSDEYDADYEEWEANVPNEDDYLFAYASADEAAAAYEADHLEWENSAPSEDDFLDEEAYLNALADYNSLNPEPLEDDYKYFADGYTNEDLARAAYESALQTWEDNVPKQTNFVKTDEFNAALQQHQDNEPQQGDYTYNESWYNSSDDALRAFSEAHTAWENNKTIALGELVEGSDEYTDALNTFLASNPEPIESDYTSKVNKYSSAEDALLAFNNEHSAWEQNVPVESAFYDVDAFNTAFNQYVEENPQPVVDDFLAKINTYASQEEATTAFNSAHSTWESGLPVQSEFKDADSYRVALERYMDKEPLEENYVSVDDMEEGFVNTYGTAEEAKAAYESAYNEWLDSAPAMDEYAGDYYSDHSEWEDARPSIEDFKVNVEDIPDGAEIIEAMG